MFIEQEQEQEGTHLPTIAPPLYLTVLVVQVIGAIILTIVTRGKLGLRQQSMAEIENGNGGQIKIAN